MASNQRNPDLAPASNLAGKAVLVTGGAGFIGSELVRQLCRCDADVVVVDNLANGKRANLDGVIDLETNLVIGDIRDGDVMSRLLKRCDIVFHLACLGLRHSIHSPIENHDVNATASLRLLDLARENGIERFIHVSTSEVYGTAAEDPMAESHATTPHTVYGAAKLAAESYARAMHRIHGLPVVIVRPFNTFGPRCHHEGDSGEVIPKFMLRCLAGEPLYVFGDGRQTRDFTFVTDTARGICLAGAAPDVTGATINIGSGRSLSVLDLADSVAQAVGAASPHIVHLPPRPGEVASLCASTKVARRRLGFETTVGLAAGLAKLRDWYEGLDETPAQLLQLERVENWTPADPAPVVTTHRL